MTTLCSIPGLDIVVDGVPTRVRPATTAVVVGPDDDDRTTTTTAPPPYDWSFVDMVYLITCPNADPGSERLTKARGILQEVGLWDRVKVMEFDTDDEDRVRGCYNSHIAVLQDAQETLRLRRQEANGSWFQDLFQSWSASNNGAAVVDRNNNSDARLPKVLVFEDNLELTGNLKQSVLDEVADFTDEADWDMIHLAYTSYVPNLVVERCAPGLARLYSGVGSALGTTSYVISLNGLDAVLREHAARDDAYYGQAIPDVMARLFPTDRYAAVPTPFCRAYTVKSLVNPQLDDLRSLLFRPRLYTQVESLLVVTGLSTNTLLPLVVGVLLSLSLVSGSVTYGAVTEVLRTGTYTSGNVLLPVVSSLFSLLSLAIIGQGVALAPKPVNVDQE